MLKNLYEYNVGNTPIYKIENRNIYLKMEKYNLNGSIKDRTAYFLIKDLIDKKLIKNNTILIESTSGNLGISLDFFAKEIEVKFRAIIDKTIAKSKLKEFNKRKIDYIYAPIKNYSNYRTARIELAKKLNKKDNYIWTNQYDNFANIKAHYQTTAPEIYKQLNHKIDIIVVAMGTGGTICGLVKFFKKINSTILICGVEPDGSTIFGGVEKSYLNVGIGLKGKDEILKYCEDSIDMHFKVSDKETIEMVKKYQNIGFGISTGYALKIALEMSDKFPTKNIVVIAPDGIEKYEDILNEKI
jgi:cysteine synthase A